MWYWCIDQSGAGSHLPLRFRERLEARNGTTGRAIWLADAASHSFRGWRKLRLQAGELADWLIEGA